MRIVMRLSAIHPGPNQVKWLHGPFWSDNWQVQSKLGGEIGLLPANQARFAWKIRVAVSVEEASTVISRW